MSLIVLEDAALTVKVIRSDRKTLGITVFPDMSIVVRAPLEAEEGEIGKRVQRRLGWIRRQLDFFDRFSPRTPPRRFVSGETHLYLGRQYRLKVIPSKGETVRLWQGYLEVHTPVPEDAERVRLLLWRWYRRQADKVFQAVLGSVTAKFPRAEIPITGLLVRRLQKRWGSCSQKGAILLNLDLIRAPKTCIEYTVIHELCHLYYPNHSAGFYRLLEAALPDWRDRKDRLERMLS